MIREASQWRIIDVAARRPAQQRRDHPVASYSFVTVWRLDAPIERVYDAIRDSMAWPSWWRAVTAVDERDAGDPETGIGNLRRYTFKGALPYTLAFDLRVERIEPPRVLAGRATGELEGTGVWTLAQEGQTTVARYDWNIRTTRWWMNLLAPFAAPVFRRNHDFVMNSGARGLCTLLGGVSGTCSWAAKPRWSWRG